MEHVHTRSTVLRQVADALEQQHLLGGNSHQRHEAATFLRDTAERLNHDRDIIDAMLGLTRDLMGTLLAIAATGDPGSVVMADAAITDAQTRLNALQEQLHGD